MAYALAEEKSVHTLRPSCGAAVCTLSNLGFGDGTEDHGQLSELRFRLQPVVQNCEVLCGEADPIDSQKLTQQCGSLRNEDEDEVSGAGRRRRREGEGRGGVGEEGGRGREEGEEGAHRGRRCVCDRLCTSCIFGSTTSA